MGEVYRARDLTLDRDVAIKIVAAEAVGEEGPVRRFLREAQAASALNHPNIISVFDVGECEAGPFIVMELVEGRTLRELLRTTPGVDALKQVGTQAARALAAAHAAGILHRDIKPDNVMIRPDGYVKVLDFGLARAMAAVEHDAPTTVASGIAVTGRGEVVGTVAYMSPEQARNEPLGPPSDVFSLGVVLYELLTGRHPFEADAAVTMVARMFADDVVPPSRIAPEVPPALDALIGRMLDKHPARRPQAGEVGAELDVVFGTPGRTARSALAAIEPHTVGRDSARAELLRIYETAADGRGALATLSGEPGIGKTTLAEEFIDSLRVSGERCHIGRGRCSERQAGSGAYLPWLEALDSLRGHAGSAVAQTLKAVAPTWHALVAPPDTGESPEGRALTVNRAGSQEWMKRELCAFFEEIAHDRTVVLFFDDLHWADESTIDVLAYLAARLRTQRILVIATYRPADLRLGRHVFLPLKLELEARGICRDIALDFLSEADVGRYLDLEFPGHRFPATFATLVHDKTEGNPLFMADLVRSFRHRGMIRRSEGAWELAEASAAFEREIPASIRSMIELKVTRLEEGDRRLLTAASVEGVEFGSTVIARSLGLDQGEVEERLEDLGRTHALIQPVREEELPDRSLSMRYRFVHVLYQNALYASLGPGRRASLSLRVAEALMAAHGDKAGARAAELAYLFEAGRDFSRAAEFYLIASERSRQVYADREALALAERALAMVRALPDTPERVPRELKHLMGVALPMHGVKGYAASELEELFRRIRHLCDRLGETPELFGAVAAISAFHFMRAELAPADEAIQEMQRLSEMTGDPVMTIWSEWAHGATYSHFGRRLSDTMQHLDRGVGLYDAAMHPGFMLMTGFDAGLGCAFQAARVAWMLGRPDEANTRIETALEQARRQQHPLMLAFVLFFQSWIRQHARDPQGVLRVMEELLPLVDRYGYPHVGAWARTVHGWAQAHTGNAVAGEAAIRQALGLLDAIGVTLMRPNLLALLAEALAAQGRLDEALATLDDAAAIAERTEERCYLSEIQRLSGELRLQRHPSTPADLDAIERQLRHAAVIAREQGARTFHVRVATTLAQFLAARGRGAEARAALGEVLGSFPADVDSPDLRDARACYEAC